MSNSSQSNKAKAKRHNQGKPQLSLVPLEGVTAFCRAGEMGIPKYGRDNWHRGLSRLEIIDSLLRHTIKLADPSESDIDEESGLNEADHIVWNAMVLAHAIKNKWPLEKEK